MWNTSTGSVVYGSQFLSKFQKGVRAFVQNLYPNINYKAEHLFYSNINCNTFNSQYSIEQTPLPEIR
jgi:hypothetical protein